MTKWILQQIQIILNIC